jgi:hypothetical protein
LRRTLDGLGITTHNREWEVVTLSVTSSLRVMGRAPNAERTRVRPARLDRKVRRRLAERDRVSARLAELAGVRTLLESAQERVRCGWVQGAWFSYRDTTGVPRLRLTPHAAPQVSEVTGVCLVTSVRASAPSGGADRALDVVWHTMHHDDDGVRWTPSPDVRRARVRDLTRWNDRPSRQSGEVTQLLADAVRTTDREMARLRTVGGR